MFVYSMRAGTIKLVGVICVALTVLITLIAFVPTYTLTSQTSANASDGTASYTYDKIKTDADVIHFLSQFGWEVESAPVEVKTVTIPTEFDKIFAAYNELQRAQGLDLSKHTGKDVTRYTFAVKNYEGYEGTVYANVLVRRERVIAGDVCSADVTGFVHGFKAE